MRHVSRRGSTEKAGYLRVRKQIKSLLVGGVGLLKVILHEVTMTLVVMMSEAAVDREGIDITECTPDLAVVFLEGDDTLEVIDSLK